jgi:hypothetical protein
MDIDEDCVSDSHNFEDVFGLPREATLTEIMSKSQIDSQQKKLSKAVKLLAEFLSDPDVCAHRNLKP